MCEVTNRDESKCHVNTHTAAGRGADRVVLFSLFIKVSLEVFLVCLLVFINV